MEIKENGVTEEKKERKMGRGDILLSFYKYMEDFKKENDSFFAQDEKGEYILDGRISKRYEDLTQSLLGYERDRIARDISLEQPDATQIDAMRSNVKKLKSEDVKLSSSGIDNDIANDVGSAIREELIPSLFPGDDNAIDTMDATELAINYKMIDRHFNCIQTASSTLTSCIKKDNFYMNFFESEKKRIAEELNSENEEESWFDADYTVVEEPSTVGVGSYGVPGLDPSSFISTEVTPKKGLFGRSRENRENKRKEKEDKKLKQQEAIETKQKETAKEKEKDKKSKKKSSNAMLNVIKGLSPIPNEYYATAINKWVELFKAEPTKTSELIDELIEEAASIDNVEENESVNSENIVEEVGNQNDLDGNNIANVEGAVDTIVNEVEENVNAQRLNEVEVTTDADEMLFDEEQTNQRDQEMADGVVTEQQPQPPQQPAGIENLAADALWQDMYLAVGELKNEKGQYKIGNTTASLLRIASNQASPEELSKVEQKRVKEILIQAYTNHAEYMLSYDAATLFEEIKSMGINIDFTQLSGDNQQEQMAKAIAEAKYKFYEGCDLSPKGWSRLALFELSQAKNNPETGDVNNRRNSPFYRELQKADIVFDLSAYQEAIQENINSQLEEVELTSASGPHKEEVTIIGPDGKEVNAFAVEINGVNCYISNPSTTPLQVIETDTIDQTKDPKLVDINDVIDVVARDRELAGAKVVEGARANAKQLSQITSIDTSNAPTVLTTFEKDGATTTQVTGPSL